MLSDEVPSEQVPFLIRIDLVFLDRITDFLTQLGLAIDSVK